MAAVSRNRTVACKSCWSRQAQQWAVVAAIRAEKCQLRAPFATPCNLRPQRRRTSDFRGYPKKLCQVGKAQIWQGTRKKLARNLQRTDLQTATFPKDRPKSAARFAGRHRNHRCKHKCVARTQPHRNRSHKRKRNWNRQAAQRTPSPKQNGGGGVPPSGGVQ